MQIASKNFAKTLVCNRKYDVANSVYPVTMTTAEAQY